MLINTETKELVNAPAFRHMYRHISLPARLTDEVLAPYGFATFTYTADPPYDADTQTLSWEPALVEGSWQQVWTVTDIEFTPEEQAARLAQYKRDRILAIDAETSQSIFAGFTYAVDGVEYRFSYDTLDQINFADTANLCILAIQGLSSGDTEIQWKTHTLEGELVTHTFTPAEFLTLYTTGALAHKNGLIDDGEVRKVNVEAARTIEQINAA